jgi:hypothetical protein
MDTGDVVMHGPSGETWTVAYVRGDHLAWCGWPEGEALTSDCKLVKSSTSENRLHLLHEMAAIHDPGDRRRRYALARL